MLGELVHYVNQDPPPPQDADTTCETLAYLEACNLLFEQGFLSHDHIRRTDSDIIKNINKGYEYISKWLDSILDKGMYNNMNSTFGRILCYTKFTVLHKILESLIIEHKYFCCIK